MSHIGVLQYCFVCRHYHVDWPCIRGTSTAKSYGQSSVPRDVNLNQTTISLTLTYESERANE
jgi:predicted secreted protein